MAPGMPQKVIGIRPGEKLHEIMCPQDDSHLTLEFDDHFVIKPTISFAHKCDFALNGLGERGEAVQSGFEYNSGINTDFLSMDQIREFNRIAGVV